MFFSAESYHVSHSEPVTTGPARFVQRSSIQGPESKTIMQLLLLPKVSMFTILRRSYDRLHKLQKPCSSHVCGAVVLKDSTS